MTLKKKRVKTFLKFNWNKLPIVFLKVNETAPQLELPSKAHRQNPRVFSLV